MRVLVVEDEPKVRRFIEQALKQDSLDVESLENLDEVENYIETGSFDVLVLDRMLGNRDSLPLIPKLRKKNPLTKILILSALSDVADKVSGLSMGADDYLAKPFHVSELLARVRVLSRRSTPEKIITNRIEQLGIEILLDQQQAFYQKKPILLTGKELRILILLMEHPQKVFSKMELLERIWGLNFDPESNVVEVTIKRLRAKLEEVQSPDLIHTRRGSGYWFGTEISK